MNESQENTTNQEFADFDWQDFARDFLSRIPASARPFLPSGELDETTATQAWLSLKLPVSSIAYLIQNAPLPVLWTWLNHPSLAELKRSAFKGFQQKVSYLKNPTVRVRLVRYFKPHESSEILILVRIWGEKEPTHPFITALQNEPSDLLISERLGQFLRDSTPDALLCAATFCARPRVFETISELMNDEERLEQLINEAEPSPTPDSSFPTSEAEETQSTSIEKPDHTQLLLKEAQNSLREKTETLAATSAQLRQALAEIESLKKHEATLEAATEKKLVHERKRAIQEKAELQKLEERQSRRLKASEKEREEAQSDARTFKKQLRHTQQILEDERKKSAALQAKIDALEKGVFNVSETSENNAVKPTAKEKAPKPLTKTTKATPLDQLFRWVADGHEFQVTPREVIRHIDANDADFAFRAQMALDGMGEKQRDLRNTFLHRLREVNPYYAHVLTQPTQRALVDASNVVRHSKNRYGKGELRNLLGMKAELRARGFFPIVFIADASLRHHVDEINKYNELINRGHVQVTPSGTEADEFLVREARNGGGYVVTNDQKFWFKVSPDFQPPSISFRIFDGIATIEDF